MSIIITKLTKQKVLICIVQLYNGGKKAMDKETFVDRLTELRINKGVSARDMSLSIGQSAGYINNIENGINYPSMNLFFYICEYLGVTPKEFFDTESNTPEKIRELSEEAQKLSSEQLDHIIAIVKGLNKQ